jgi:radial spoke head protein 4A
MTQHSQSMDLKRLLHEAKDQHHSSLFDHICSLLSHVDNNHAEVALEEFENISQFLSSTKFAYKQYHSAQEVNQRKHVDHHGVLKHLHKVEHLLKEHHYSPDAWVQDFSEINCDWNIAGYGFKEEEARLIHLTLERLAAKNNCERISFLGIIRGSVKDYYVAYGRLKAHVKDKLPESWEGNGFGVNAVTFWVTNESTFLSSVLSEWVELPAIGPDHINVARFTKHALTGDLNAPVIVYPEFKGKEKHFLKAQLSRMLFNCEIVPTGMYRLKEDAKEDEKRTFC